MKKLTTGLLACFAAVVCFAGPRGRGLLLLRFDDRNFDGWEKALPLFEKTGAHATFFINGAIDGTPENFRAPMRELAGLTSLLTQVQTTEQKGKSHDQ